MVYITQLHPQVLVYHPQGMIWHEPPDNPVQAAAVVVLICRKVKEIHHPIV